jgi:hypothetical protein
MPAPSVFSVKQPWAGLLVTGVKRYEARTWYPTRPAWLLVHASSGKATGLRELGLDPLYEKALRAAGMERPGEWTTSAVVGAVKVSRVWHSDKPRPQLGKMDLFLCGSIEGMALWEVSYKVQFRQPISCKGKLNFWQLQGDVLEEYERLFESGQLVDAADA